MHRNLPGDEQDWDGEGRWPQKVFHVSGQCTVKNHKWDKENLGLAVVSFPNETDLDLRKKLRQIFPTVQILLIR